MRTVSDYCYAWAVALTKTSHLHDIGAKYHKFFKWMSWNKINIIYHAWRPYLFPYDTIYNVTHKHLFGQKEYKNHKFEAKRFESDNLDKKHTVIANDCVWYDLVFDELIKAC